MSWTTTSVTTDDDQRRFDDEVENQSDMQFDERCDDKGKREEVSKNESTKQMHSEAHREQLLLLSCSLTLAQCMTDL
jgi:hypothetical protein